MKKILPSVWTRSSHPSGRGPRSSTCGRLGRLPPLAPELGRAEGRPDLGSTHVVFLSVWLMKKTRPLGATCSVGQWVGSEALFSSESTELIFHCVV